MAMTMKAGRRALPIIASLYSACGRSLMRADWFSERAQWQIIERDCKTGAWQNLTVPDYAIGYWRELPTPPDDAHIATI